MPHLLLPRTIHNESGNGPEDTSTPARLTFSLRVSGHPAFPRCRDAASDGDRARDARGILHAQMLRLPLVFLRAFRPT